MANTTASYTTTTPIGTTANVQNTTTNIPTTIIRPCGIPNLIANGFVKSKGPYYPNGTKAEYSCFTGYQLQGAPYIVCTIGSVWASLPPTCVPKEEHSSVNTDVDVHVDVQATSDEEWEFLLLIMFGSLIGLALLGLLLAWCCKLAGCFHSNTVLPYMANYRQLGCCCCKRYVRTDQRIGSTRSMHRPSVVYHDQIPNTPAPRHHSSMEKEPGEHNEPETARKIPEAKRPATWMPHVNTIRKINTSTK